MKFKARKTLAVVLSLLTALAAIPAFSISASADSPEPAFTLKATSNYFAAASADYYTLSSMEDENGDIFLTVEYKMYADSEFLINIDIDELTYDPNVLEWSTEYNSVKIGRNTVPTFFSFAVENGFGPGTVHQTEDGRIVGNFAFVNPPATAYNDDGTPITVVKSVFKLLDKTARETTVNCAVDFLALCDTSCAASPFVQHQVVANREVNPDVQLGETLTTVIAPPEQEPPQPLIGDVNGDGEVTVNDATLLQRYLAEYTNKDGSPLIDLTDDEVFVRTDANADGAVDVRDVTAIQRIIGEFFGGGDNEG